MRVCMCIWMYLIHKFWRYSQVHAYKSMCVHTYTHIYNIYRQCHLRSSWSSKIVSQAILTLAVWILFIFPKRILLKKRIDSLGNLTGQPKPLLALYYMYACVY